MKKHHAAARDMEGYIASIEQQQRNITPHDLLRNGRSVDEVLFKGRRDAPLVQRIGIFVVALAYVIAALAFISLAAEQHAPFLVIFAFLLFALAGWFIRNAFLRKKPNSHKQVG